jgi:DNA-directed RNA polymerase subunit RPC12/RpoP
MQSGPAGEPEPRGVARPVAVPVYSLPLAKAHYNCPACETPVFFKAKPDNRIRSVNGSAFKCGTCGQTLGRYVTRVGGIVWLEVVGRTPAIDVAVKLA